MVPLQYRHYNLPPDFPVVAFLGEQWVNPREDITYLHFHDCLEFGICRKGRGILHTAEGAFSYKEGDLCVIPCYMPHIMQSSAAEESNWEYIFFDPHKMWGEDGAPLANDERLMGKTSFPCPIFSREAFPELHGVLEMAFEEFRGKSNLYQTYVRGSLLAVMAILKRALSRANPGEASASYQIRILFPAIRHIQDHYGDPVEIPALAKLCHLSPTHFRRLFHQVMQSAPLDYVNRIRISMACRMLVYSKGTVGEIAQQCGFPTLSSFHRAFRRYFDMTPTQWKRMYQACSDENAIQSLEDVKNPLLFQI